MIHFLRDKTDSTQAIEITFTQVQKYFNSDVELLKTTPGEIEQWEATIARFYHLKTDRSGWWFRPEKELIDYIETLPGMAGRSTQYQDKIDYVLSKWGEGIRRARQRQRLQIGDMCERTGLARSTVSRIEKGAGSVNLNAYATVMLALGLEKELLFIAEMEDARGSDLRQRVRKTMMEEAEAEELG